MEYLRVETNHLLHHIQPKADLKQMSFPKELNTKSTVASDIGIVILDLDQAEVTLRCLRSIAAGTVIPYRIVIVQNGPLPIILSDITLSKLQIKILHPKKNLGCAGGRNIGITWLLKNIQISKIMILDNDTVVTTDFFLKISQIKQEPLEAVSPIIYDLSTGGIWSCGGIIESSGMIRQLVVKPNTNAEEYSVDWAPGACLIFSREIWEKVGRFDDWLNFFFEDIEWCCRLRNLGGRVVVNTELRLLHEANLSLGGKWSPTRVYFWTRNGTVFNLTIMELGIKSNLKWISGEVISIIINLTNGRLSWSIEGIHGLVDGLSESLRRHKLWIKKFFLTSFPLNNN